MLTNEQRAHDLAILMVEAKLKPEFLRAEAAKQSGVEVKISIDEIYFEAYDLALDAVNKRFS